jgi:hypothetical protein
VGAPMKVEQSNRYSSIPKRSFKNAIIRLLEEQFKILGSHKVLQLIADEMDRLHKEYYPEVEEQSFGNIIWRTTSANCKKPSYGKRVEDYEVKTVILPLVTEDDIEKRIRWFYGKPNQNYEKQRERDIRVMARLIKSAYKQGGLLSGAELSVLLNRSLGAIGNYIRDYHKTHTDILPTKGLILDQGSRPTHKAAIISLFEQGYPEVDIARLTDHDIESTSRYISAYKNIKLLIGKDFNLMEMVRVTGMGRSTIIQYRDLVYKYHPKMIKKEKVEK